jgi:predicted transcriptional regulator
MADLRESLDELAQTIEDENPEHDMKDAIDNIIEAHDAQVADERAMMDDCNKLDISC